MMITSDKNINGSFGAQISSKLHPCSIKAICRIRRIMIKIGSHITTTSILARKILVLMQSITQSSNIFNTSKHYFAIQMRNNIDLWMVIAVDTHARIRQLMQERGWTEYRLAKESGLSQSTIANLFSRNTVPSISTLESICNGLGITLGQFFSDGNLVELSAEQKDFFDLWASLTADEKDLIEQIVRKFKGSHSQRRNQQKSDS